MICPCSGMPPGADYDECCRPAFDGQSMADHCRGSHAVPLHRVRPWQRRPPLPHLAPEDPSSRHRHRRDTTWLGLEIIGTTEWIGIRRHGNGALPCRPSGTTSANIRLRRTPPSFAGPARWVYLDALEADRHSPIDDLCLYWCQRRIHRPASVVIPAHGPLGEGERILGRTCHGVPLTRFRAGGDLVV